ncbi:CMD domain protein [Herbaspirillum lusitanum]|jgi:CMD domain protein|uniref:CMD domain protein n=1 Tax=Herbaspirillum lusitanum TaxID=213312 RepID=A0ABW9AD29_9BURK
MSTQAQYNSTGDGAVDIVDIVDRLSGLPAGSPIHTLRHQREKVAAATQGSYDTLFDPTLEGIGLDERLLVALYACRLTGGSELIAHYRERLLALPADAAQLKVVEQGVPEDLPAGRLQAMLAFTRALTERPVEGDKAAIETLPAAGISTPAVVALAQLIAFISYQVRVVAGLKAMDALNKQVNTAAGAQA